MLYMVYGAGFGQVRYPLGVGNIGHVSNVRLSFSPLVTLYRYPYSYMHYGSDRTSPVPAITEGVSGSFLLDNYYPPPFLIISQQLTQTTSGIQANPRMGF